MTRRIISLTFASLALACTVTTPNDSAETEPATSGASTSGTAGTSGTSDITSGPAGTSESGGPGSESTSPDAPTTAPGTEATGDADAGESDSSGEPGTAETGTGAVSFTDVYEQVILPNGCNAGYCHGGGAGGLTMTDEATSYANLVEVAAAAALCDQTMRVVPGSLDESILWYRVRPSAQDGDELCAQNSKMPMGSMGLSDAEAKLVSDWISGGALE